MDRLFNDGVRVIYSYQTIVEWTRTAATSKRNFILAQSQQQQRKEKVARAAIEPTFAPHRKKSLLSCCTSTAEDEEHIQPGTAKLSAWSLRHQISAAEFVSLPFHIAPQYLMQYPKLQSLTATIRSSPDPELRISRYASLHLPHHVTHLDLTVTEDEGVRMTEYYVGFILRSIGECELLTRLTIRRFAIRSYNFHLRNFSTQWKSNLTQLTHLDLGVMIPFAHASGAWDEFLSAISSMTNLTQLRLQLLFKLRVDDVLNLNLPNLKKFTIAGVGVRLGDEMLTALQSVMPNVEEIDCGIQAIRFEMRHPNLSKWARFTKLKTFHINRRSIIDGHQQNQAAAESIPESALVNTLVTMVHLTRIQLWQWYPMEVASWSLIDAQLLSLTDLDFGFPFEDNGMLGFDDFEAEYVDADGVVPFLDEPAAFEPFIFNPNVADFVPAPSPPPSDPLTPMTNGAPQLLTRLQRLSFSSCRLSLDVLQQLRPCTSLCHLLLDQSLPREELAHFLIYETFDDGEYLPCLKRVSVTEASFSLLYDTEEGKNQCKFRGQRKEHEKLYRDQKRSQHPVIRTEKVEEVIGAVPAPHLVGIELNPGPAPTTASTLFSDGLRLIFEFCYFMDWYHSALVSREWFKIASTMRCRDRNIYPRCNNTEEDVKHYTWSGDLGVSDVTQDSSIDEVVEVEVADTVVSVEISHDVTLTTCAQVRNSWSLKHHVSEMTLSYIKWSDLRSYFSFGLEIPESGLKFSMESPYPSLRKLEIFQLGLPPLITQMQLTPFPNSLTDLKMRVLGGYQLHPRSSSSTPTPNVQQQEDHTFLSNKQELSPLQYLLEILEQSVSSHLQRFELDIYEYGYPHEIDTEDDNGSGGRISDPDQPPCEHIQIDWSPLRSFQQLHTFKLADHLEWIPPKYREAAIVRATLHPLPDSVRLTQCCGQLPLLTELYTHHVVSPIPDIEFPFSDFATLTLPRLRVFDHGFHWNESVIEVLHRVQPNLEEFHARHQVHFDLPLIVQFFPNVKKFIFDYAPWNTDESDSLPEETIITALEKAKSLTSLELSRWHPDEINSYVRLAQHLVYLTHLTLSSFDTLHLIYQGLSFGTRPLIERLTYLVVEEGKNVLTLDNIHVLGHFISLQHLKIQSTITITDVVLASAHYTAIYEKFNDLTFLPHLRYASIEEGIQWDPSNILFWLLCDDGDHIYCRWRVVSDDDKTIEFTKDLRLETRTEAETSVTPSQ